VREAITNYIQVIKRRTAQSALCELLSAKTACVRYHIASITVFYASIALSATLLVTISNEN
jgi:hypothetical protein